MRSMFNKITPYNGITHFSKTRLPALQKRGLMVINRECPINNSSSVKVIKITGSNTHNPNLEEIFNQITRENPNSLGILTIPSMRIAGDYLNYVDPGHNAAFGIDEHGKINCDISKRQTGDPLCSKDRVPDSRFPGTFRARMYSAAYIKIASELLFLNNKCAFTFYIHLIPFQSEINSDQFRKNVNEIKDNSLIYCLHSTRHPIHDTQYIPASNCNAAVEQSIFGYGNTITHDMACQEAVMNMVTRVLQTPQDRQTIPTYHRIVEELGLLNGIELSPIPHEAYERANTVI